MRQKDIISNQQHENAALRRHVADYKYRHDAAINALAEIASGLGRKRDNQWSAAFLAADHLCVIAKMPLREAP